MPQRHSKSDWTQSWATLLVLAHFALSKRLDWMMSRGPFQPQPFCDSGELQVVVVRRLCLSFIFECHLRVRMAGEPNVDKLSHIFHMQHNQKIPIVSLSCCHECTPTILNGCHLDLLHCLQCLQNSSATNCWSRLIQYMDCFCLS